MFLRLPFEKVVSHLQQSSFLVNTVILIITLIVVELTYSELPKQKREHLKLFYPLFVVLVGLLIYAAYKQTSGA